MRELELPNTMRSLITASVVTMGALTMPLTSSAQTTADPPRPAQARDLDDDMDMGMDADDDEQSWGWIGLLGLAGLLGLRRRDRDDVRFETDTRRTL